MYFILCSYSTEDVHKTYCQNRKFLYVVGIIWGPEWVTIFFEFWNLNKLLLFMATTYYFTEKNPSEVGRFCTPRQKSVRPKHFERPTWSPTTKKRQNCVTDTACTDASAENIWYRCLTTLFTNRQSFEKKISSNRSIAENTFFEKKDVVRVIQTLSWKKK